MNLITNPAYNSVPGNIYHTFNQVSNNLDKNISHVSIHNSLTQNQSIIVISLMIFTIIFMSYIMYRNLK